MKYQRSGGALLRATEIAVDDLVHAQRVIRLPALNHPDDLPEGRRLFGRPRRDCRGRGSRGGRRSSERAPDRPSSWRSSLLWTRDLTLELVERRLQIVDEIVEVPRGVIDRGLRLRVITLDRGRSLQRQPSRLEQRLDARRVDRLRYVRLLATGRPARPQAGKPKRARIELLLVEDDERLVVEPLERLLPRATEPDC